MLSKINVHLLPEEILSDFWCSHIRYLIFDIQLDIRLIFGGGKLAASILGRDRLLGGNKRIIISAAVAPSLL